jgi:uncharacterized protein (TIGR00251 family)
MANLKIQSDSEGVVFGAKIVPGSSKTVLCGLLDDMLKIKIAAAPEKGKANECLTAFLARQLGIKKNAVHIISGQSSPVKHIQIIGLSELQVRERLGLE